MKKERRANFGEALDPRRIEVVDRATAAVMGRMTGEEKIRMACELGDSVRRIMLYQTANEHPDWTEEEVRRHVARRVMGGKAN